jgi:hypothetical protein
MFLKGRIDLMDESVRRSHHVRQTEERIQQQQEMAIITIQASENKRLIDKEREQLTG